MGANVLGGVAGLLYVSAYVHAAAPCRGHADIARQDAFHAAEFLEPESDRTHASPGGRLPAPEGAHRAAARFAGCACLALLAVIRRRSGGEACPCRGDGGTAVGRASPIEARSGGAGLSRSGADAGRRR